MNRVNALRLSFFVSLGLVPVACGGTTRNGPDEETGGTVGTGGSSPQAGTMSRSGSSSRGGSSAQAGTGGSGTGGSGGGPVMGVCTSPVPDPVTGLVACAEGFSHRPTPTGCGVTGPAADPAPGAGFPGNPLPRAVGNEPCDLDPTVCSRFLYGYCKAPDPGPGPARTNACSSGCSSDNDCGVGAICVCGDPQSPTGGACVSSGCRTDQDCGEGQLCASYSDDCFGRGFACQTAADFCESSMDCPDAITCYWGSFVDINDQVTFRRMCGAGSAACGRPFLVDAAARVAPVVSSNAWTTHDVGTPRVDHLTATERSALAVHWTKLGQMEHASIAAFARFSLQLLALGAPPELVDACTAALADETAHTKLCFSIASAYAGRAIGPGPLDVSRSLEVTALVDIVDLVIAEGCFGETSAALEALEAADTAADPVIVAAYSQIAADEQRHAELAFHFVRWALERGGQAVAERVAAAITTPPPANVATLSVAVPCLRALLTPPALAAARAPANLPAT